MLRYKSGQMSVSMSRSPKLILSDLGKLFSRIALQFSILKILNSNIEAQSANNVLSPSIEARVIFSRWSRLNIGFNLTATTLEISQR